MTILFFAFIGSVATLGLSAYFLGVAITEDIKGSISTINVDAKMKENRSKFGEQFNDFIGMHVFQKELSVELILAFYTYAYEILDSYFIIQSFN